MSDTTVRLTVGQALVRFLARQQIERDGERQPLFAGVFGIFGHGNVTGIGQALEEFSNELTYYRPQNEQAMVHTAAAFAKVRNRLQTFACTSSVGPGATNMVTGAALATINRLPVLLLPGDVFASRLPHPVLQQLEYPLGQDVSVNDCFRPVSRYFDRIWRPDQLLSSLPEAIRVLTDPAETGAVTLALPEDVQTEAYPFPAAFFNERVWRISRNAPSPDDLDQAAQMIRAARSPLIIAGGGVIYSEASEALGTFAEQLRIPVAESQAGKGALPWDHPWCVGPIGTNGGLAANRLARDADLVIAVGTRLGDFVTASHTAFQHPDVRFMGINVAAMDAHKLSGLPLVGDARATLQRLSALLDGATVPESDERAAHVTSLKATWNQAVDEQRRVQEGVQLTQANVIGIVNDAARPNDVVVCAAGGMPGDLLKLWRPSDPKGYHVEYGYSCMGYEIAGGLGVKIAAPDREVFIMCGDGSYLMLHTEIVTSIQEGYKLTIVLVDNSGFQCIRGLQTSSGTPAFGNELRYRDPTTNRLDAAFVPVDFARNAESLGARAFCAENEHQLRDALDQAVHSDRTALVWVRVDTEARVPSYESWWDVPVAAVSGQETLRTARSDYETQRRNQRYLR